MDSHPKSIGMARKDSRGSNRQGIDGEENIALGYSLM